MIQLQRMTWSNWFSYGENNTIDFTSSTLTQIIGANGSGKSSIPLILQETLFGKNAKNIKKQNITNRNRSDKSISSELVFFVDDDEYKVVLKRKASVKLLLYKNGEDISSHTATNTYKKIEEVLGTDYKTLTQLIYQSSKEQLHFLTSTDSQRKAFLVALFNLNRYLVVLDKFKLKYKEMSAEYSKLEGTCDVLRKWIVKHKSMDLSSKELLELVDPIDDVVKQLVKCEDDLSKIANINRKISQNNEYRRMLQNIDMQILSTVIQKPDEKYKAELLKKKTICEHNIKTAESDKRKLSKIADHADCPTCGAPIKTAFVRDLIRGHDTTIDVNKAGIKDVNKILKDLLVEENKYKSHIKATREFESITAQIDDSIDKELLDKQTLVTKISEMKKIVNEHKKKVQIVTKKNLEIAEHNSKIKVIEQQLVDYDDQLTKELDKLLTLEDDLSSVDILRKAFSATGFINYKLESLAKKLETEINNYLQEFSDGVFQLKFDIKGDKLNIVIINNGNPVEINSLSSGELAKVNVSTLLAIRKLMSSIYRTKINVLFLDEIMGVLDQHSRDKLIEMLLEEKNLNTYLVSHEYTHPLLEKIHVVKEKDISRLEYG